MMLAAMKLQKSQVKTTSWRWTAGQSGKWHRALYIMAGFKKFEMMAVGGAGGRSGNGNATANGTTYALYWSGGGGGGGHYRRGSLFALPTIADYSAGRAGNPGPNVGVGSYADGEKGWDSSFAGWFAYGGEGGEIPRINASGVLDWRHQAMQGGTASVGTLVPPDGGRPGENNDLPYPGAVQVVSGTSETPDQVIVMSGGGGATGKWAVTAPNPFNYITAHSGAAGAVSAGAPYQSNGDPIYNNNFGGGGGGVNIAQFTKGAAEYFGSGYQNAGKAGGIVLLKVS